MSTKFLSPGWRMPRNANQSKSSNYSLDFDGSSLTGVEVGTLDFLNSSASDFTISMWVKPTSRDRGMPFTAGPTNWIYIYYFPVGSYNEFRYKIRGSATQSTIPNLTSENEITPNKWYHITLTSEGTVAKFYLNGDLLHTGVSGTSYLNSGDNVMIGKWGYTANYEFHGLINSASIFNYALSASQVTTLWGGGTSVSNPMALPSPPIAYYPLGESAGGFVGGSGTWLTENNAIGDYVFNFNGASYIDCGNDNSLQFQPTDALTFSCWFNAASHSSNSIIVSNNEWTGAYRGYNLQLASTGVLKFTITSSYTPSNNYIQISSTTTISTGSWYHIVITKDTSIANTSLNMYINGSPASVTRASSGTLSTFTYVSSFNLGGADNGSQLFGGKISNAQVFNTELSSSDAETLYNYGSPIQTLANIPQNSNLKAWYKLDASEIYNSSTTEWSIDNNQNPSAYPSSLDFDGTNDYIGISNSTDFNLGTSFTISGWFNVTSYVSNMGYISFDSSTRGWFLFHQSTNLALYDGAAVRTLNSNLQPTNEWNSYIITYDGTDLIFYLNGQQNSTQSVSINLQTNGNDGQIGNQQFAAGRFYNGYISNVAIYNTALSASNVVTLYNNGTPQATIYGSPVAHWKLDNTTTGIQDSAGSNDGTNNGASDYAGFVNVLAGDSTGMSQSNLVQSDLQTVAPYSKYALSFDGIDGTMLLGNTPIVTGVFTISMWIKRTSTSSPESAITQSLISKDAISSNRVYSAFLNTSTGILSFWVSSSGAYNSASRINTSTAINDTEWHNVVFINNGDNINNQVYVDGAEVSYADQGTGISSLHSSTINLTACGNDYHAPVNAYCSMSNISMWTSAFSSFQVREIYNEGLPSNLNLHSSIGSIASWWQCGENSSFDGSNWTCINEVASNNGVTRSTPVGALVNGVGTTANGTSTGMSEGSLVGDAPYSTANAISSGMAVTARGTDVPPTP